MFGIGLLLIAAGTLVIIFAMQGSSPFKLTHKPPGVEPVPPGGGRPGGKPPEPAPHLGG